MQNKIIPLITVISVLFLTITAWAEDFSAEMINKTPQGSFEGKIFVSKDKTRMETAQGITITRLDKGVMWILMPEQNLYMEQPFDPANIAATAKEISGEIERTLLGKELVDGRMTSKYQIVYEALGIRNTVLQWLAADLNIPVKTAAVDGSWMMEYKNIKMGKQPDSLFEIPAGYKKFSYQLPSADMLDDLSEGEF